MRLLCGFSLVLILLAAPVFAKDATPKADADPGLGVERILADVRERAKQLDARERELEARERAISELESQVEVRIDELEELLARLEKGVADFEKKSGDRVARLVKVYAAMPAGRAAPLLEELDPDLTTEIIARMKHKQSAAILTRMSDEEALRVSARVARPLAPAKARR